MALSKEEIKKIAEERKAKALKNRQNKSKTKTAPARKPVSNQVIASPIPKAEPAQTAKAKEEQVEMPMPEQPLEVLEAANKNEHPDGLTKTQKKAFAVLDQISKKRLNGSIPEKLHIDFAVAIKQDAQVKNGNAAIQQMINQYLAGELDLITSNPMPHIDPEAPKKLFVADIPEDLHDKFSIQVKLDRSIKSVTQAIILMMTKYLKGKVTFQ